MIQRIFYPIGQGAFYSEKHEKFNIVYDCGNWRRTNVSGNLVRQSFSSNDVIDILFISHFDYDHISRIDTLRDTVGHIKRVVMPLLHKEEKIFLSNIFQSLGFNSIQLINNPRQFFGNDTQVTFVAAVENEDLSSNVESQDEPRVESGEGIRLNDSHYNWVFIPHNFENKNRSSIFEQALSKEGFDVEKLRKDPDYAINHIETKAKKNRIKKIYHSIQGGINQNSMVVYSGCTSPVIANVRWFHKDLNYWMIRPFYDLISKEVSCIYTGDVDLNVVDLRSKFDRYWNYIGAVQVPHHGALKDFNSKFIDKANLVFPISYGKTNTYGHPSSNVISQIVAKGGFPLHVTEEPNSVAIQNISSKEY